ncbi:MAG TPA: thiamine-phosphate kinase [Vicinamibacterales bacterium]|nr:thiamine-phosphate kinase [Vicinamibacterales bacterium]
MRSPGESSALPGERALIERIRRRLPAAPPALVIGPGDDAAVVAPQHGALQVLTTDAVVEGVHFDRRFSTLADAGYRALAVNLSDLAAMGATPAFALLSFMLPDDTTTADVDALMDGILELAAAEQVTIAGGNISRSPGPLVIDVTATGHVRPRRILTRGGGRPGDALYVTGSLGAAAAGLDWLRAGAPADEAEQGLLETCARRHRRPQPRTRIGRLLGGNRAASACMDLSDGLADAVRQLAEASGTGAVIDGAALPIDPAAARWFENRGRDPILAAAEGGDDFELLFAVPKKRRGRLRAVVSGARGVPLTRIGELTASTDLVLQRGGRDEPLPQGYVHF